MKNRNRIIAAAVPLLLLSALFLMQGINVNAKNENEFEITNGVLTAYHGTNNSCVIPAQVTAIGPDAFKNCLLTSVTIPSSVQVIHDGAFYGSENLGRVTIEEGVREIGASAFAKCSSLYMISIPASVSKIQAGAFSCCGKLASLQLDSGNSSYFYNDGVLYNNDSTELVQYLAGRKFTSYTMLFSVKRIDKFAFWGASLLSDVRISNNVTEISSYAFANCTSLTSVYLPESVKKIDAYGFANCTNLDYVGMENNSVDIHNTAFEGCSKNLVSENGVSEASLKITTKASNATNATVSLNKPLSHFPKSFRSSSIKYSDLGVSEKGVLGASKIVDGKVLVILSENSAK